MAAGIALGDYIKGVRAKTYLIIGDGESQEGQIWEAAMFTAAKKLTNLIWLIDENKKQLDGDVDEILPIFDLKEKFAAFASRRRFDQIFLSGGDMRETPLQLLVPTLALLQHLMEERICPLKTLRSIGQFRE